MEDLSKFTDQELVDRWRASSIASKSFRSELEDRGYLMQWKTSPRASWSQNIPRIKSQIQTEYRFVKTEVQVLA